MTEIGTPEIELTHSFAACGPDRLPQDRVIGSGSECSGVGGAELVDDRPVPPQEDGSGNRLVITNGGAVFALQHIFIGSSTNSLDNRIIVERETKMLTVYKGSSDEVLFTAPVAVGTSRTPTPLGDFYVDIVVKTNNPSFAEKIAR